MVTSENSPQAESTERFARRLVRELQQLIIEQEAGAVAGNVEAIHDMRVGIRRLRVALSNFVVCLAKDDRRQLRLSLESLADALGAVRDLDVMIDALKLRQANPLTEKRLAVGAFIRRLRGRRRRRHQQLIGYLGGEEYARFKQEFPTENEDESVRSSSEDLQNEQAA